MSPEELQILIDKIADAEKAYHLLLTGNKPRVFVDQNGERVEFMAANANKLYMYIQGLRQQLAAEAAPPQHNPNGPASFFF